MTELDKQTHIIEQLLEIAGATDLNFAECENQTRMIWPLLHRIKTFWFSDSKYIFVINFAESYLRNKVYSFFPYHNRLFTRYYLVTCSV